MLKCYRSSYLHSCTVVCKTQRLLSGAARDQQVRLLRNLCHLRLYCKILMIRRGIVKSDHKEIKAGRMSNAAVRGRWQTEVRGGCHLRSYQKVMFDWPTVAYKIISTENPKFMNTFCLNDPFVVYIEINNSTQNMTSDAKSTSPCKVQFSGTAQLRSVLLWPKLIV